MTRSLEALFDRYRTRGDVRALARVFDRAAPELLRVGMHLVRDPVVAEDMLQETFLTAIEHAERYDRARPLVPWLVGILTNHARRHRRAEARRPDPTRLPERAAEADDGELAARVAERIDALPDRYRQIVFLRLRFGMEPAAIADLLGMPPATVRTRLHRGIEKVRARLPAGIALAFLPPPAALRGVDAVRDVVVAQATTAAVTAGTTTTVGLIATGSLAVTKSHALVLCALLIGALAGGYAIVGPSDLDDAVGPPAAQAPNEADGPALVARGAEPAREDALGPAPDERDDAKAPATPDVRIQGRVVDMDGGSVPGAAVDLWLRRGSVDTHLPSIRADDRGRYATTLVALKAFSRIELKAASLWARARAPGYRPGEPMEFELVSELEGAAIEGDLPIEPGISVEGRVLDTAGEPVPGARVSLRPDPPTGYEWLMRADALGRYALGAEEPGAFVVEAAVHGRRAAVTVRATRAGDAVRAPDLVVDLGAGIAGRTLAMDGSPLPGVIVLAEPVREREDRDDDGDDEDGDDDERELGERNPRPHRVRSDRDGRFALTVAPGQRYRLWLEEDRETAPRVVASPGEQGVALRATVPAIVAVVVDGEGHALPGAMISQTGWHGHLRSVVDELAAGTIPVEIAEALSHRSSGGTVTAIDGIDTLLVAPETRWIVSARVVGAQTAEAIVAIDAGVAVKRVGLVIDAAAPDGHLDLRVLQPDGTPLTNFAVALRTPLGSGLGTPSSNAEGVLPPLHSGDLCIRVLPHARRNHLAEMYGVGTWLLPARARVTVPPAGRAPLTVQLAKGGRFRLRLIYPEGDEPERDSLGMRVFPAGEAVRFVYARMWSYPFDRQTVVSSVFQTGAPRLNTKLLAPGTYRIEVRTQDHGTHERDVVIRAGAVTDVEIELPARGR